jgi:hypothetical protein
MGSSLTNGIGQSTNRRKTASCNQAKWQARVGPLPLLAEPGDEGGL